MTVLRVCKEIILHAVKPPPVKAGITIPMELTAALAEGRG